jgi:hypothetical protein
MSARRPHADTHSSSRYLTQSKAVIKYGCMYVNNSLSTRRLRAYCWSAHELPFQSKLFGKLPSDVVFNNESMFLFTFAGGTDAPQIKSIKEFVDTKMLYDFQQAMGAGGVK